MNMDQPKRNMIQLFLVHILAIGLKRKRNKLTHTTPHHKIRLSKSFKHVLWISKKKTLRGNYLLPQLQLCINGLILASVTVAHNIWIEMFHPWSIDDSQVINPTLPSILMPNDVLSLYLLMILGLKAITHLEYPIQACRHVDNSLDHY